MSMSGEREVPVASGYLSVGALREIIVDLMDVSGVVPGGSLLGEGKPVLLKVDGQFRQLHTVSVAFREIGGVAQFALVLKG